MGLGKIFRKNQPENSSSKYATRRLVPSKQFWEEFEAAYKASLSSMLPTIMNVMQPGSGSDGEIHLALGNMVEASYQMIDITAFISGTYYAALLESNIVFSTDEDFLAHEFFAPLMDSVNELSQDTKEKNILKNRFFEYGHACQANTSCGKSMNGYLNLGFDVIEEWCKNPQVKCALLLCDFTAYRGMTGRMASLGDLQQLQSFAKNNTKKQIDYLGKIYNEAYPCSMAIFNTVSELINSCK